MFKNIGKKNKIIIGLLLFVSIFLISSNDIYLSHAQSNGELFSISSNFSFFEYSKIKGIKDNVSSINIELPEPNWTITNIKINFSNINLGREIKSIEDTETGLAQVWNKNSVFRTFALSMQIEILEVVELFGVFIKGYKTPQANEIIKFQLKGFDNINLSPNNTIYKSIDLNISTTLDWYYQDFSSGSAPISLPIGNYTLVMNGTNLSTDDQAKYYWQNDEFDPQIPYLHTSSYVTSWSFGLINSSFLCKLNQRVDRTYLPKDLNLTAEVNGEDYEVINGPVTGKGTLEITNFSYYSNKITLEIPLKINRSIILNFNYNYSISLTNEFLTIGSASIKETNSQWALHPIIDRISSIYHVKFNFPRNWFNLSLYRKSGPSWENITSFANINMNASTLIIPNDIILGGVEWKINANSPNIFFNINLPELEWEPGQELQFSVNAPSLEGNFTFYFINSLGFGYDEPIEVRGVISEDTIFSYIIPSNSREGTYTIIIYWNNSTDGGVQSQDFEVNVPPVPFTIDPIWIVIGIIIAIVGTTTGILSYRRIKKYRTRKIEESQKLYNKCMDVLNLDYIIVSDKKSGLNLYQQKFTEKEIDAAMISGFLQAIHSFGIELIKIEDSSQTIKLEYKDSIIIMTEFVNLRLILIMKQHPSSNFLFSLEDLAYDLYKYYGEHIDQFNGNINPFKSIDKLLKHHLSTSLTYPLKLTKIEELEKVKISPNERALINKAISFMKINNTSSFYLSSLLLERECSPKDLELIFNLIDKNIFQIIE